MLPDFPFFLCKADILFYNSSFSASFRIEVQCGHLVASMSISLLQNGHTFVVGAGSSSFFAPMEVILLTVFRRQNFHRYSRQNLTSYKRIRSSCPAHFFNVSPIARMPPHWLQPHSMNLRHGPWECIPYSHSPQWSLRQVNLLPFQEQPPVFLPLSDGDRQYQKNPPSMPWPRS